MNLFDTFQYKSLSPSLGEWLRVATKPLCEEARQRITAEITDHFDASVASKLAEGATPGTAQSESLLALGDARKAKKEFLRTNLSASEAKLLAIAQGVPSPGLAKPFGLSFFYAIFSLWCFSLAWLWQLDTLNFATYMLCSNCFSFQWLAPLLHWSTGKRSLHRTLANVVLVQMSISMATAYLALSNFVPEHSILIICASAAGIYVPYITWELYRKLGKTNGPVHS